MLRFLLKKKKVFNRIKYSLFKKDNKLQLLKRSLQDRSLKKESRINNMDLKKLKEKTVDINVGEILEEPTKIFFERKKKHVVIFSNLIHLKCYFTNS